MMSTVIILKNMAFFIFLISKKKNSVANIIEFLSLKNKLNI